MVGLGPITVKNVIGGLFIQGNEDGNGEKQDKSCLVDYLQSHTEF